MAPSSPAVAKYRSPLAVYRYTAGLTQQQLADRASITRESVANLEAGKHRPRRLTAQSIGAALGVDPTDLFPRMPRPRKQAGPR